MDTKKIHNTKEALDALDTVFGYNVQGKNCPDMHIIMGLQGYISTIDSDVFGKAIVEELRVNWAFDTDDALSVLNGAERRMKEK